MSRFSLVLASLIGVSAPVGAAEVPQAFAVPYRLSLTKHVLVRVKINGQGPYHFILDTGAPTCYVSTAVARKLDITPNKDGWATIPRLEIEGGVTLQKLRGRVEDPFQLEGMNGLGIAGVQLHGILGFAVLARFRIELDVTRDKMIWTRLEHEPVVPERGGRGGAPAGLEMIGSAMKLLGGVLGKKSTGTPVPRGFLGIELDDGDHSVSVKSVLPGGPADIAGVKPGDRLLRVQGRDVGSSEEVLKRAAKVLPGAAVSLTVRRGSEELVLTVKAGEGL